MSGVLRKVGSIGLCFIYAAIVILVFSGIQIGVGFFMAKCGGLRLTVNDGAFTVCYCVVTICVGYLVAKLFGLFGQDNIIRTRKLGNEALCSVLIAFGMLGVVTLFIVAIGMLAEAGVSTAEEELARYDESVDRFATIDIEIVPLPDHVLSLIGSAFLVPLAEEITFRGFIMGFFSKVTKPMWAIILSSAIFGAVHGTPIQMLYAFACGLVLAWIYHITGSIWGSYLFHMTFNFFGGALGTFFESGIINLPAGFTEAFNEVCAYGEILMIGPAVGGIMYLMILYRKRTANEQA